MPTATNLRNVRLAVVGLGSIGTDVVHAIRDGQITGIELVAAAEPTASRTRDELIADNIPVYDRAQDLPWNQLDVVLEATSQTALKKIAPQVVREGVDLVVLSAGATLDVEFLTALLDLANRSGSTIWFPSGALGALDVVRAASVGDIDSITLTTTKHPAALSDAPHIEKSKIDLGSISSRREVFSGGPVAAVRGFPQNVNVAALLSLAAGNPNRVHVRVIADPKAPGNVHEVAVRGSFGNMTIRLENEPSTSNPKTSALAAQSVVALLRQLSSPQRFG
jgi:aspartate dehydrogenase